MLIDHCLRRSARLHVSALTMGVLAACVSVTFTPSSPLAAQSGGKKSASKTGDKTTKGAKSKGSDSTGRAVGDGEKKEKVLKPPLFDSIAPLAITLTTNQKLLFKDRSDNGPYHPATIAYAAGGKTVEAPVRIRTHGIWRLNHCEFPPTRLNFANKEVKNTPFHDLDEPKLVSYCRNNDSYEQYVLQEFQLYRIYQLLTPLSHKVRLLRITYADSIPGKKAAVTRYGFIVEDPAHLAQRNNGKIIKLKGATPGDLDTTATSVYFMFQYLIGNTDFSVSMLHNSELVGTKDGINYPIGYDFDFSGAVDAIYATVDPRLQIKTVREREFRGFCGILAAYPKVFPLFLEKKAAIYALYSDEVGQLMSPKVVKQTLAYLDDFYDTISKPRDVKRMLSTCVQVQ